MTKSFAFTGAKSEGRSRSTADRGQFRAGGGFAAKADL